MFFALVLSPQSKKNKDSHDFWIIYWLLCCHDFCPYSSCNILILSSVLYVKQIFILCLVKTNKALKYLLTNYITWDVKPSSTIGFFKNYHVSHKKRMFHDLFHLYGRYIQQHTLIQFLYIGKSFNLSIFIR